ncbi:hypothetical protein ACFXA3_01285 [Streptomyces sp. NPDC059456]|uniref:hypothetical protein n=1 Tax=Streptomyces sp. NPDC059456 TaxID=3346838 RepID=UPI0036BB6541
MPSHYVGSDPPWGQVRGLRGVFDGFAEPVFGQGGALDLGCVKGAREGEFAAHRIGRCQAGSAGYGRSLDVYWTDQVKLDTRGPYSTVSHRTHANQARGDAVAESVVEKENAV